MTSKDDSDRYFRRIEEHFGRRRDGPLLLSPRDWRLVNEWYERDIPLEVVLGGINRTFDRFEHERPAGRRINSLRYCAQAVEEKWEEWQQRAARLAHAGSDADTAAQAVAHLRDAVSACSRAAARADEDGAAALRRAADSLGALADRAEAESVAPAELDTEARAIERALLDELDAGEASPPTADTDAADDTREQAADAQPPAADATAPHLERLDLPRFSPFAV